MSTTQRQMLNVRIIGTTFRVALDAHPGQLSASIRKARSLLADARAAAGSDAVRDAIAAVEAEVEAASLDERRLEA